MSPEIKIIAYLGFVVSLFFIRDVNVCLLLFIPFFLLIIRIPFKTLKSGWVPISLLLTFTFLSNMFYQQGRILFSSDLFVITQEGIHTAVVRTMRVFFMIAGVKILMASTGTGSLIGALRKMLKPLEKIKIPVEEFFQILELTFQSLPLIREQTARVYRDKVMSDRESGYLERIRTVSTLLVPIFVQSIRAPDTIFKEAGKRGMITASGDERNT